MYIPDEIRKCVVFVALEMANGEKRLVGTAWLLSRPIEGTNEVFLYIVTTRHVIDGIRSKGLNKVFLRLNHSSGNAVWYETDLERWLFHPSDAGVDVAVLKDAIPPEADHLHVPIALLMTPSLLIEKEIGIGDDVFLVGLFAHHAGENKNIPIVRVGNIAAMPEEPVNTRALGRIDAYLIEARSIGGLSGSPVFVHMGSARQRRSGVTFGPSGPLFYLIGMMHGHWDGVLTDVDQLTTREREIEKVNMGIGIVVPIEKVLAIINQPSVLEQERQVAEIRRREADRAR